MEYSWGGILISDKIEVRLKSNNGIRSVFLIDKRIII